MRSAQKSAHSLEERESTSLMTNSAQVQVSTVMVGHFLSGCGILYPSSTFLLCKREDISLLPVMLWLSLYSNMPAMLKQQSGSDWEGESLSADWLDKHGERK